MDDGPANQVSLHVPRMYRVAYRLLADDEAAQDVVQEVCVKALASLGRFNGQASLATWLHRITVNCATDHLRSRGRRVEEAADLNAWAGPTERAGASPATQAETNELIGIAQALVEGLPDDCRSAFVLTQLDGYSYNEAAAIEDLPRGTMASRVWRAKKILLAQMNARTGVPADARPGERTQP